MEKHVKIYMSHHGYCEQDWIPCEVCGATAVDVHHIEFGKTRKNDIENLIGLCRSCHDKAHKGILSEEELKSYKNIC